MANAFTREERVMFDKTIEGFDDLLVAAKLAERYTPFDPQSMQRVGDRIWIPAPMIAAAYDGFDQTSNFGDMTELAIPITIGFHKSVNGKVTAKDLRNENALRNYGNAARQTLSSEINRALFSTAALQGSQFVKRTTAPTGFDDLSAASVKMTKQGVPLGDRKALLGPTAYAGMASQLGKPATSGLDDTVAAYRKSYLGPVAAMDTFMNDQSVFLGAATGGATTVNGSNQYWVPKATSTAGTGETENVDNRYSDLVITAATYANIKAGDAFTIAGVNAVHMITKQDVGELQTFRVIGKPTANTIRIAPALISGQGGTKPEQEYKNVTATPATGAALTWLNTTSAELNPFFVKGNLLLIPGSYAMDEQAGWSVLRATTDLGIAVTYTRQGEINDLSMKFRWDIDFGTALTNPQMAGTIQFSQA